MALRRFKPTSPARRLGSVIDFKSEIQRVAPEKSLVKPKKGTGGRNAHGHVTSRHRGGGHKQQYRMIDFRRDKDGVPAVVASVEYDPTARRTSPCSTTPTARSATFSRRSD